MPDVRGATEQRVVDILLAEYNALRSEIVSHVTVQAAVVGLGFTGIGVVAGLVAKTAGGDQVLLLVPPMSFFVVLIYSAETYRSAAIEIYIYQCIWPRLESEVGTLPSWERHAGSERRVSGRAAVLSVLIDLPAMSVFVLASGGSLVIVRDFTADWWAGVGFTVATLAALGSVAWIIQRDSAKALLERCPEDPEGPSGLKVE
jgi:hypothetical protein